MDYQPRHTTKRTMSIELFIFIIVAVLGVGAAYILWLIGKGK